MSDAARVLALGDARLMAWGRFASKRTDSGLGYPRISPSFKDAIKGRGSAPLVPDDVFAVDGLVGSWRNGDAVLWWAVYWWFEGITLKLAEGLRYTPDFLVMNADCGLELHEVKGARAIFRDDAKAKVKMAAEKFPFTVRVVYPVKGRSNSWEVEDY